MGVFEDTYNALVPEGSTGRGIDAAVTRQFDDTEGGGILDADTYNPFNNTQAEEGTTEFFGITYDAGSGVGYQPGQGQDSDPYGYGPSDPDTSERDWQTLAVAVALVIGGASLLGSLFEGVGQGLAGGS